MSTSNHLFEQAKEVIPGGVNSPVRAFKGVGGAPVFIEKAKGAYVYDVDGREYIDYVGSWGPMILGHNHEAIKAAISEAIQHGLSFGAPTQSETLLAELITRLLPAIDMIRMVNSGTEATMSAIRLARGFTGRDKVIKFEGCYHGHGDSLLVKAGSGALTLGEPSSPGIPKDLAQHTLTCSFNDLTSVSNMFLAHPEDIACLIVEPVAGNMNCIPPLPGFLEGLRNLCDQYGTLLIFDEVMTGFRVALGGAQAYYGVQPDLTTLGKIIGGGMPVGALGGRRDIMEYLVPVGPVYQAGTLSGNPVAMAAGYACLSEISKPGYEQQWAHATEQLVAGMRDLAQKHHIPLVTNHVGGMFGFFFTNQDAITCLTDVQACDLNRFKRFFHLMLEHGVYLAPSAFEASFMSLAHNHDVIKKTLHIIDQVFALLNSESHLHRESMTATAN